jgi:5'-nucleotidase
MEHISMKPLQKLPLLTLFGSLFLTACMSTSPRPAPYSLSIAHINDHHSQLEPHAAAELTLNDVPTRVSLGGYARVKSAMDELEATTPNLLKLHAGDAITGTLYYTFFKGQADASMMNAVCFDAFTLGNHEFDDGDKALKGFLEALGQGDCRTAVLSANIQPAAGTPIANQVQPYAIKKVGGVDVGIIGLTIADKTMNSSRPLNTTRFTEEVLAVQNSIDALRAQGISHIVLLSHQGYARDQAIASQLTDLDAIIGGDSHSLLGQFDSLTLNSSGAYPTLVNNKDGHPVCIGQAWEYSKAIGLMKIDFNSEGQVTHCGGQAQLLIGDDYARKTADGKWLPLGATNQQALSATLKKQGAVRITPLHEATQVQLASYATRVEAEKQREMGMLKQALCLVRVPGESTNRSASVAGCEQANTLAQGGGAPQAVASTLLAASKRADVSLQNAGSVRSATPAGAVNMNQIMTMLPYTNVLVELSVTGAEIQAILEDAVSNHLDKKASDGSHPYAAGLRWDLDMSLPRGQRFSNLQIKNRQSGAWVALQAKRNYVLVTNDFIAEGKDGYSTLGAVSASGRKVNTYLLYTQIFSDHLKASSPWALPSRADYSHQKVITAAGRQLD